MLVGESGGGQGCEKGIDKRDKGGIISDEEFFVIYDVIEIVFGVVFLVIGFVGYGGNFIIIIIIVFIDCFMEFVYIIFGGSSLMI